jgi:hypothetical protein
MHTSSQTLEEKHMLTESPLASTSSSPITTSTTLTTTTKPTFSKDKDDDGKLLPPSDATNDIDMRTSDGIDVVSLEREVARTSNAKRESSISSTIDDSSEIGSSGHDMGPPDAEKGLGNFGKVEEEKEIDASVPYTHILIPPPGHNYDGMDIMSVPACADKDENETNTSSNPKGGNSFRLRLFGGKTKAVIANDSVKDVDNGGGDNSVRNSLSTIVLPKEKGQSKVCSNVCTICLMEYEPSERVSWSSNKECTHVFHEDCIIHWLVSLGRTKSKMTRFSEEPTEAQLLNYELECPCCRQEFVVSNNTMEWGGGGGSREDENV